MKLAEDIEYVHRMRVASRRLRTRLTIFAPWLSAKKSAAWQKQIRRITRALGEARDTDVQLHCVEAFRRQQPDVPFRPGLDRLTLRLQQRRIRAQQRVVKVLQQVEHLHTLDDLAQTLRQLRVLRHLQPVPSQSPELLALAGQAISTNLAEMLSYEPYVHQPEAVAELHAMRIATKHFRYAMEIFAALYPDELKKYLQTARNLQDLLGEIHDSDVWTLELAAFLEKERRRAQRYFGHTRGVHRLHAGIEALAENRRQFRAERYRKLVAAWDQTVRDALWQELQQSLGAPAVKSDE